MVWEGEIHPSAAKAGTMRAAKSARLKPCPFKAFAISPSNHTCKLPGGKHNAHTRKEKAVYFQPCVRLTPLFLAASALAFGQSNTPAAPWQMQDSGTTAGLRGIFSVDGTIVWASGTGGTVLKTLDGGAHWTACAIPDAAADGATLDFRGVQAWDATTAIVMASGPGDKSRLYKTTDGCKTWTTDSEDGARWLLDSY